ncbi:MAG: bifunctional precorrin-2 dehydrogenase/sirohydrochlorin ferrochelatase [Emergencia sp.]
MENRYFPVFVSTEGRKAVIFGGGAIAERRVSTLLNFQFDITVVSPAVSETIAGYAAEGHLKYVRDIYSEKYLEDCFMAVACTDDRDVNREIGRAAKQRNILVSVCDSREECSFYFPAVAVNEEVTAGVAGDGSSHHITRRAAAAVRDIIERKAY